MLHCVIMPCATEPSRREGENFLLAPTCPNAPSQDRAARIIDVKNQFILAVNLPTLSFTIQPLVDFEPSLVLCCAYVQALGHEVGLMSAELLDQLLVDAAIEPPPAAVRKQPIQKINYSHDGLINMILAHRGVTQNQLAAHFGYSASWISQIMSSDAFQARLAERAAEIEDPTLRATVEEQIKGMLARSIEILKEKLSRPAAEVPDNLALRSLELASRALGFGASEHTVNVQVNMEAHLESLGGRLTGLLTRKKAEVIDQSGFHPAADQGVLPHA